MCECVKFDFKQNENENFLIFYLKCKNCGCEGYHLKWDKTKKVTDHVKDELLDLLKKDFFKNKKR